MAKAQIPKHQKKSVIDTYIAEQEGVLLKNHETLVSFSFKYLVSSEKFPTFFEDAGYLPTLMQRLTDVCSFNTLELIREGGKSLRCHPIKWKDVTENNFGLKNEDQLVSKPYQFQISANAYGRVHGFFIQDIFFVRWLDPHHNLYE